MPENLGPPLLAYEWKPIIEHVVDWFSVNQQQVVDSVSSWADSDNMILRIMGSTVSIFEMVKFSFDSMKEGTQKIFEVLVDAPQAIQVYLQHLPYELQVSAGALFGILIALVAVRWMV